MTAAPTTSIVSRTVALDTIASVLPIDRRDKLAELLTDQDVETLRNLVNQGMGENTLRALTSDLAYLETWSFATSPRSRFIRPLSWPSTKIEMVNLPAPVDRSG